ncbi:c-di-GMP-binding flagellar brake protein YcgR [Aneurinibacillus soli]|uniref:Flagellar brake protein YcgR n=1 Tax=Aneurinibacillus soli TaxID=1500254 RepID=A0A0U5ATK7_9BACL|nr:PilZ domain-containing protein [Aneurinibacillus soli]PYE62527.1 c-di-GMP-binding flagellar brake protein YcgR [Aneurinibacillus soli]BAU27089.1 Flagellar brake protein YcgR [Aneurinibacillus soli]
MLPKTNEIIYIESGLVDNKILKTVVSEVTSDAILVMLPVEEGTGRIRTFFIDDVLIISYPSNGCQYRFKTKVIDKTNDVIPLLCLQKPEEKNIKRIQRRMSFRVPLSSKIVANIEKTRGERIENEELEINLLDISEGGIRISCDKSYDIEIGDKITGNLEITDEEIIPFEANIVRRAEEGRLLDYKQFGIQFHNMNTIVRQKIIRFCIMRQIELRKKLMM